MTKVEVLIYILHKFKHQRVYRVAIKLFLHILQFVILIPNDYCQLCIYIKFSIENNYWAESDARWSKNGWKPLMRKCCTTRKALFEISINLENCCLRPRLSIYLQQTIYDLNCLLEFGISGHTKSKSLVKVFEPILWSVKKVFKQGNNF